MNDELSWAYNKQNIYMVVVKANEEVDLHGGWFMVYSLRGSVE